MQFGQLIIGEENILPPAPPPPPPSPPLDFILHLPDPLAQPVAPAHHVCQGSHLIHKIDNNEFL